MLARVLSWAENRGLVVANPCAKGGRLYRSSRIDKIWTDDDAVIEHVPSFWKRSMLKTISATSQRD